MDTNDTITSDCDPRDLPHFNPVYLPLCDGGSLPSPHPSDPNERLMIEFAAVYYALNKAIAEAEAARQSADGEREVVALRRIAEVDRIREHLEDRCAIHGFDAKPVMEGKRHANLLFTYSQKRPKAQAVVHEFSAEFKF